MGRQVARDPGSTLRRLAGGDPGKITGRLVTEAAQRGDEEARGIIAEAGRRLGQGIAGLVNVIDPQVVVVGGGAIVAGDLLLEPARAAFREAVEGPEYRPGVPLVAADLGNDAGAVGAAARPSRSSGARWPDVKVGLVLPMATGDAERVLAFARRAEELGFDGLFAFDHLFPPGAPSDRPSLEAFAMLAGVAAVTSRVSVGTLVARASLRSAGMLAKQAVTLDGLSAGRFVLGIGTGDEGAPPSTRPSGSPTWGPAFGANTWWRRSEPSGRCSAASRGREACTCRASTGRCCRRRERRSADRIAVRGPAAAREVMPERVGAGPRRRRAGSPREPRTASSPPGRRWLSSRRGRGGALVARRERGLEQAWGSARSAVGWLRELERAGATWAIVLAAGPPDRIDLIGERVLPAIEASG
jgi:alkanesulfonate monooxygenase SsuD/methylene tetrahydromethanopterin reductase-like flavin-dependent oxidoreductase (luciferase family)